MYQEFSSLLDELRSMSDDDERNWLLLQLAIIVLGPVICVVLVLLLTSKLRSYLRLRMLYKQKQRLARIVARQEPWRRRVRRRVGQQIAVDIDSLAQETESNQDSLDQKGAPQNPTCASIIIDMYAV